MFADLTCEQPPPINSSACGEREIVELRNGSLLALLRSDRGGLKVTALSNDYGENWSWQRQTTMHEPSCEGSLVALEDAHRTLLFAGPGNQRPVYPPPLPPLPPHLLPLSRQYGETDNGSNHSDGYLTAGDGYYGHGNGRKHLLGHFHHRLNLTVWSSTDQGSTWSGGTVVWQNSACTPPLTYAIFIATHIFCCMGKVSRPRCSCVRCDPCTIAGGVKPEICVWGRRVQRHDLGPTGYTRYWHHLERRVYISTYTLVRLLFVFQKMVYDR